MDKSWDILLNFIQSDPQGWVTFLQSTVDKANRTLLFDLKKIAPEAKWVRRYDPTFKKGALRKSIRLIRQGSLTRPKLNWWYYMLDYWKYVEFGTKGWAGNRFPWGHYHFDVPGFMLKWRPKAKFHMFYEFIVYSVGYCLGLAGRVARTPFVAASIETYIRYSLPEIFYDAFRELLRRLFGK